MEIYKNIIRAHNRNYILLVFLQGYLMRGKSQYH